MMRTAIDYVEWFGFDINMYETFLTSLFIDIQKTFDIEIHTKRLMMWEGKFSSFDDPVRVSRSTPSVKDKLKDYVDFLTNPKGLKLIYQDLILNFVNKQCDAFFKERMSSLKVSTISKKAISFQDAAEKIIDGKLTTRVATSHDKQKKTVVRKNKGFRGGTGYDGEEMPYPPAQSDQRIQQKETILENVDHVLKSVDDDADVYVSIYRRYRAFFPYLPLTYLTFELRFEESDAAGEIKAKVIDLTSVILNTWNDITDDDIKKNVIAKRMVECLYDCIVDFYEGDVIDGDSSMYDVIVWMLINDPWILINHPSREPFWKDVEEAILEDVKPRLHVMEGGGDTGLDTEDIYGYGSQLDNGISRLNFGSQPDPEYPASQEPVAPASQEPEDLAPEETMEYMTLDDYIDTRMRLDRIFAVDANLAIMTSYDEDGNYIANVVNRQFFSGGQNVRENKESSWGHMRLRDYHRKYYKTYYRLYY
jgi:hypothetical protein